MRKVHVPSSFRIGLPRCGADQALDGLRKRRNNIPVLTAGRESAFSAMRRSSRRTIRRGTPV
jgi:hypothetical protein